MKDRVEAKFSRQEDRVLVDLGRPIRFLDMDCITAYAWANALIKLGQEAQRVYAGHARMSRKEVEQFEESICGTPKLYGS